MSRISTKSMRELLSCYFIMGSTNCKLDPFHVLEEAIAGGITLFQFREKGEGAFTGERKYHFASELQRICKKAEIPFIVNDDVDLALELEADGIHIGQDDESANTVRSKLGDRIVGVSAHNKEEVQTALSQGADYIGMGPIYPTTTKQDTKRIQGTSLIQSVREEGISVPIVGIGGITADNAKAVIEKGGDGVSVISEISMSDHPAERAQKLVKAIRN